MTRNILARAALVFALAGALFFLATDFMVEAPSANAQEEKTADQVYKNIQVFKDLPASELDGVMSFMSTSLGVGCTFCHVNPWESDQQSAKQSARRMILMMRSINKENYGGGAVVNCFTCHKGQPNPDSTPAIDQGEWQAPEAQATDPKALASLPSADEITAKYIRAIGGMQAIERLRTRVSKGTLTNTNRMTPPTSVPLEIYQEAPDRILTIGNYPRGVHKTAYNGSIGWSGRDETARELSGEELSDLKRDADFYNYLKLKEQYPAMRLLGKERIRNREVYAIGATSKDGSREKLYFDVESGLLLRKLVLYKTALGNIPEITDFEDYKTTDGVKMPFTIRWSRPPYTSTQKFAEIKQNVPVDESKFDLPARK